MKILITSGGTAIPIDRVRRITNMSHGTFGSRIGREALMAGHEVLFLKHAESKSPFTMNVDLIRQHPTLALNQLHCLTDLLAAFADHYEEFTYKTYDDYAAMLERVIKERRPDIVILAAAVSDYGTVPLTGKIRSKASEMSIQLHVLPKLIGKVKEWLPETFLVGFKLLVDSTDDQLLEAAHKSLVENKCGLVVANDLSHIQRGKHEVFLVDAAGESHYVSQDNDRNYLARTVVNKAVELAKAQGVGGAAAADAAAD